MLNDIIKYLNTGSLLVIYQNKISSRVRYKYEEEIITDCFYILPLEDATISCINKDLVNSSLKYSLDLTRSWQNFSYTEQIEEKLLSDIAQDNKRLFILSKNMLDKINEFYGTTNITLGVEDLVGTLTKINEDSEFIYYIFDYSMCDIDMLEMFGELYVMYWYNSSFWSNIREIRLRRWLTADGFTLKCEGDEIFMNNFQVINDFDNTYILISETSYIPVNVSKGKKMYIDFDSNTNISNGFLDLFEISLFYEIGGNLMNFVYKLKNKINFNGFFDSCTLLVNAKNIYLGDIPNNISTVNLFFRLFRNCSNLVEGPDLVNCKMNSWTYGYMFMNCTSLKKAPSLNNLYDLTGGVRCLGGLFYGCTSLEEAPEIPNMILSQGCFFYMFYNCKSLKKCTILPNTTLAKECYDNMFTNCTSLEEAPELPADVLPQNAYNQMFMYCSKLRYIKCAATRDYSGHAFPAGYLNSTKDWVWGVSSSGVFYTKSNSRYYNSSNIPTGWTVVKY